MSEMILSDRDVIGVERFLIKRGFTKKKPKFKTVEAYAKFKKIKVDSTDEYERIYIICYHIQTDFKTFRDWFELERSIDLSL